jgi:two-component system cell cycle sensor histidine kinase/response regulator CckA
MGSSMNRVETTESEDISKPVDVALRISEARYRRLFETAQDGILIIDAKNGDINDVNPFLVDLLGYEREDFIGMALWNFGPFKDIRASQSAFQELMHKGYIRYEHLPLETKDGRRIEVEFISNAYQVGQQRTIQCNIRDNSKRKHVEQLRLKLESQLKQAQKMAAVATLAGGIAHQFNNALTVITGSLDLLEADGLSEAIKEHVQPMKKAADQMARLTRQLLAYARGGKYNTQSIFLNALVEDSLPLVKSFLNPSITIETDLPSDLSPIVADRDQMQMALLTILANASEAIGKQGVVRIVCRRELMTNERAIAFAGLVPGIYVSLTVADNGKGMDEKTCRRVFEPFFTTHFPGRGLGMAAVYGIVKNHDGWISIESQVDQGTVVCIYLPTVDPMIDRIVL